MSTFVGKEAAPWDKANHNPNPHKPNLPLHAYPLEKLIATLKRNETILKNSRALEKLPDRGKKLMDSNALIRDAIQFKMKQSKRGVPRPKPPDSLTPPQLGALDSQLQNLSLSTSSLDSSGASSSGRQSLSSVASDISPVNHPLRPTRVEPRATSTISLREAIRIRQEEESRRCKAQALRLQARQNLPTPPHASYYPFAMFIEDDSDDFDGFSEDEYI